VTVGASTIADVRADFSNYGSVVKVFAPGENVISSWIGSDTATNDISGTSMATPHVTGLIAYLIALNGNVSPATMSHNIQTLGLKAVLTDIPAGTVNDLAHATMSDHIQSLSLKDVLTDIPAGSVNDLAHNA